MKKPVILCVLCFGIAYAAIAQVSRGGTLYTAVRTATLKSSTGFFAGNRGTVSYGEQVTVLQVSGKWVEVRSVSRSSISGWTASANFSTRRITAATGTGTASASEIALAGKGFDRDVENAYRANGRLNYADVDRTEAQTVSPDDLYRFLTDGRLSLGD